MEGVGKSSERLENNIWKKQLPNTCTVERLFLSWPCSSAGTTGGPPPPRTLGRHRRPSQEGTPIMPKPYEYFPQYHTRTLLGSPCGSWTACILRFRSFTFSLCFASCLARLSGVNIAPLGIGYGLLSRARASTAGTFHFRPCAQELWGRVGAIQCSFGTLPQCDPVFLITGTLEKSWINPMLIWHTSAV